MKTMLLCTFICYFSFYIYEEYYSKTLDPLGFRNFLGGHILTPHPPLKKVPLFNVENYVENYVENMDKKTQQNPPHFVHI